MKNNCRPTSGEQLGRMQKWPLKAKVWLSLERIKEFLQWADGAAYVSFSGGKDSTVLLHLVRSIDPSIPGVFFDTGLEFPEIRTFVKAQENITIVKPKMAFKDVLEKYGYPVVSKDISQKVEEIRNTNSQKLREKRLWGDARGNGKLSEKWKHLINAPFKISQRCCHVMKKNPAMSYERQSGRFPFTGLMAKDSSSRKVSYLRRGCNAFNVKRPTSTPIAFWTTADVWEYIKEKDIQYASIYDEVSLRSTGCIFCPFGVQYDGTPNRFQALQQIHPRLWNYCMNELKMKEVLTYLNIPIGENDGKKEG